MNSRERVLTALAHKEPDTVPVDFEVVSGIHGVAHDRLLKYFGIKELTRIWQPYLQWAEPSLRLIEKLGIDCVRIVPPPERWKTGTLTDRSAALVPSNWNPKIRPDGSKVHIYEGHEIAKMPSDGYWYDITYHPLANAATQDLENFTWMPPFTYYSLPDPTDSSQIKSFAKGVRKKARYWYENSDFALIGSAGTSIFEAAQILRGHEKLYIDLIKNKKFVQALLDKLVSVYIEVAKRYCDAIGNYAQIILIGGEDIGAQGQMQISLDLYREMVLPYIRRLWQTFRKHSDAYLMIHSCGFIEPVIDDWVEAGIDIINPVQIGAGMDPSQLKQRFGDKVTFWGGGCDTQHTLPWSTPDEIRKEVKSRIEVFAPGGGYVFLPEQAIQAEVRPENIVAMYHAATEFGRYPIKVSK